MSSKDYLDHFACRVIQDAICSAAPQQYEERAREFDAVGTPRCREMAQACRNAAIFWRIYGPELIADDIDTVMAEFPPRGWAA
ncbi:hypothetical protein QI633_11245 [Nocardioides sp. QY071]|uniref:hypothetical protein n=1 Tax=Nocardioides sp. QY071 TaxID=3044187 RepID=UPI00249A034C|nr:hypothetical protein [Nocardioides sp. QY071]WGY04321.1 hypothetical protein QI633_11245 [Nocardioides sp. QY071]